jgi:hypothetical protein
MRVTELTQYCCEEGGLTASDLAILLNRPRSTVRTWLKERREPREYIQDHVHGRLTILVDHIKNLPPGTVLVNPYQNLENRVADLERLRDELFAISPEDITK